MSKPNEWSAPNKDKKKKMSIGTIIAKRQPKSFEDVYAAMGPPGRFQIWQMAMIMTCNIPMVFINVKYFFISLELPFKCSTVNDTNLLKPLPKLSNGSYLASYDDSCGIEVFKNVSGMLTSVKNNYGCPDGYTFDGGSKKSFISEWGLVCDNVGIAQLAQTVVAIGGFLGASVINTIGDKYGRLMTMYLSVILSAVTEAAAAYSPNIYIMIVIRFVTGLVSAGVYICSFVLAFEMVIEKYRLIFSMISGVIWSCCVAGVAGFAYLLRDYDWRDFQLYSAILGLFPLLFSFFVNESPSWLHSVGKRDRSEKVIRRACSVNGIEYERVKGTLEECFEDLNKENVDGKNETKVKSYNVFDLLKHKKYLINALIMWFAFFTNELTNNGLYLTSSNLAGNLYLNLAILGLVSSPSYVVCWVLLMFKGRRFVIILFTVLSATCLLISSFISYTDIDENVASKLSLTFFVLGKFSISGGYNTLIMYVPETFPTNMRATGLGLASSGAPSGGAISPYLLPLSKLASWAPGVTLSTCCFLTSLLFMKLPETRGKKLATVLDEDYEILEDEKIHEEFILPQAETVISNEKS